MAGNDGEGMIVMNFELLVYSSRLHGSAMSIG